MNTEEKLREIIREKIALLSKVDENKLQDKVEELVKNLSAEEYEVFAFDNDIDTEDANEMQEFIESLSNKEAKDIIKQLDESKVEEYYNAPKSLEKRNEVLYGDLVPGSGSTGTIEGEMLRAVNRLIYRHENDGDYFHYGYGTETAGPAATFLYECRDIDRKLQSQFRKLIDKADGLTDDTKYGKILYTILELILDYVESKDGAYTEYSGDMFDYDSRWEEEEEEDDYYDDDDYY